VHLSTGAAPPDAWLDTHGLRVCLACREITPQLARCPVPCCSIAVLAALALGNTAPPPGAGTLANGRASPSRPGPGTPNVNPDPHAAQGPHRGLVHVHPGTYLPAAGPGTGANMGDPVVPNLIPPHCPRMPPHGAARQRNPPRPSNAGSTALRRLWTHWETSAAAYYGRRPQTAPGRGSKAVPRPWRWLLQRPKPPIEQQRQS